MSLEDVEAAPASSISLQTMKVRAEIHGSERDDGRMEHLRTSVTACVRTWAGGHAGLQKLLCVCVCACVCVCVQKLMCVCACVRARV